MPSLRELPCLIFDCQSTGATPAYGVLLEMGWCAVEGGEAGPVRSAWVALPEGERVSKPVRDVTGYRDEVRAEAVAETVLWDELSSAAREIARRAGTPLAPTLIHFAQFEAKWLEDLQRRLAPDAPPLFDVACLHAIACRLYPDLPRRGLRALSGFLGYTAPQRSRSPDHVAASAFVWRALTAELEGRGISDWAALGDWLAAPAPKRSKKRAFPFGPKERRALPDAPGVYRMRRSNGDVVYVGKATSVKKRIASHFSAGARSTERALEMLTQVHAIEVVETPSALEAALVEADEIKRFAPPYNVHLQGDIHRAWFATRDLGSIAEQRDEHHVVGPLPSRWATAAYGSVLALVSGVLPTRELRARIVGVPNVWAPGEEVFAAGWDAFVRERLAEPSRTLRGRVDKAARSLWLLSRGEGLDERPEDAPEGWDEPRVRRNLDRALVSGFQLMRRARWLLLLSDSVVVFREATSQRRRAVILRGGELVSRDDLGPDDPVPPVSSSSRPWHEKQATFDATAYDRLRVVTTELKRVRAEGGQVAVRIAGVRGRERLLEGRAIERLFAWL